MENFLTIIIKYRWSASAISGMAFFYMGCFPGKWNYITYEALYRLSKQLATEYVWSLDYLQ